MATEAPQPAKTVDEVELPSFQAPLLYVHARIPPCDTLGHKADTWNVAKPDFTCAMFCCTRADVFVIRLLTETNETFAESFWKPDRPMVSVIDAATDSSRYFALRVENPETGAHHFLGIGFAERETAGQFKLTLSEHGRYIQRMRKAQQDTLAADVSAAGPSSAATLSNAQFGSDGDQSKPGRDLSLQGSIRVALPNQGEKRGLMAKAAKSGEGLSLKVGPGGGLLPPPPARRSPALATGGARQNGSCRDVVPQGSAASPQMLSSIACATAPPSEAGVSGEVKDDASAGGDGEDGFGDFCGAN